MASVIWNRWAASLKKIDDGVVDGPMSVMPRSEADRRGHAAVNAAAAHHGAPGRGYL